LDMPAQPKMPSAIEGLEAFTLRDESDEDKSDENEFLDADSFFNLPDDDEQPDHSEK